MLERVVSGGQTGVDRAALDAAMAAGLDCGGWCPRGRRAEDGPIDESYPLRETPGPRYIERTRRNVRDSDATLILASGALGGGTRATVAHARKLGRRHLVIDLAAESDAGAVSRVDDWLARENIRVLNVAGPRESSRPEIYDAARRVLDPVFAGVGGPIRGRS